MLKKWALVLLIAYAVILLALSLMTIGEIRTLGSSFDDKINHFGAYCLLTLLIYNYFNKLKFKNALMYAMAIAFAYGFLIEWFQKLLTSSRMFDVYDILANFLGAIFAVILIIIYKKLKLK